MTRRPIGYYVHHHGAGHRARAGAIAAVSDWPITLLGTGVGEAGIDLPDDRPLSGRFDGVDGSEGRPAALHYAPIDHDGVRLRVARVAQWIATERPALMVVDVSVEMAMLARLASVPTICVRLNGERNDVPHLEAFRGAVALLAPFHVDLERESTPTWVRERTRYLPGITTAVAGGVPPSGRILVVIGRGGAPSNGARLAEAARACPNVQWRVIGPVSPVDDCPANLDIAGWVEDAAHAIAAADVVIGGAGDGLVGAVMAADRPFICIPEARPFGEQQATASGMARLGAAVVLENWPKAAAWPSLLARAKALPSPPRQRLHDPRGAQMAAIWLGEQAAAA
ncbi:hypothetical protein J2W40_003828 [Sphingobium xenophagum]|uniref:Glycosyltransferase n=1 Tax=Sphingobium xenophagum TaxID=121428 RepID=A0ABU1X5W0_SPHXE|nr:glycosyltransferase [Sphingobium xenophagum]MDR7156981.1 hypothetical protein [Sphingobium xenophagum]